MKLDTDVKLSIIVPVYMVEKYLPECIESILNQKMVDFELILVEDCSPDSSGTLCDSFANRDSRIKVIHKKQREGAAKARNTGLCAARGKYIGFVDADDRIAKDMYEILYDEIIKHNADMCCCDYIEEYVNKTIMTKNTGESIILNQKEAMKNLHNRQGVYPYLWNKIFKREILISVVDQDEIIIGEDYKLLVEAIKRSSKVALVRKALYYYRQRRTSVCNVGFSDKYIVVLKAYQNSRDRLVQEYPMIHEEIVSYCMVEELAMLSAMAKNRVYDKAMVKTLSQDIRKYFRGCMKLKELSAMYKLCSVFAVCCPALFLVLMKGYVSYKSKKYVMFQ